MTNQALSRTVALRKIIAEGIEAALISVGFESKGRRAWLRRTPELQHVIALLSRRGMYDIQWGLVSPEAAPFLWGRPAQEGDVGAAVMSGTPGSIRHPAACQSFRLDAMVPADDIERIIVGLSADLRRVEERLRVFSTRRDVRAYLLLNRDPKDRRDFVIPANLPLKLYTAATLAVIDGDPEACELIADADQSMAPHRGEVSMARLRRLRAGSAELCGDPSGAIHNWISAYESWRRLSR